MAMKIRWGNSLETLANHLFDVIDEQKVDTAKEVFAQRDCIVVPNRIQEAWLQHQFLFDRRRTTLPHVLANCDFKLMTQFVTDWISATPSERASPEAHPFSVKSLRWKIYDFLQTDGLADEFAPLARYVATKDGQARDARKCFKLASRLGKLMDEYVTYRPAMLAAWEDGSNESTDASTAWEPALWRKLVEGHNDKTYLAAFRNMGARLKIGGIEKTYRRIFVFAPSMLPGVYLEFFRLLGAVLPVDFSVFNPSSTDWFDRDTLKVLLKGTGALTRPNDPVALFDARHPLLSAYARGSRDLVAGALDLMEGQVDDPFDSPAGDSVLAKLQRTILDCDASLVSAPQCADGSIQLHLCHGRMREVEILRDQLLNCFNENPKLQPRQIQVQVADMSDYAPYIEAVFSTQNLNGKNTIPYIIADRVVAGESLSAEAFRQLLALGDSRFTAPEILDLLRCDTVARRFGFEPSDVDSITAWINQAGVRWGRDSAHREQVSHANFTEETTWRHGLDRLLIGYAMGQEPAPDNPSNLIPRDCVEGNDAAQLGRLSHFYEMLTDFADFCQGSHPLTDWISRLEKLVDDFFINDNETYQDVGVLKSAIRLLRTSGEAAGYDKPVPAAVVRDFLSGQLSEAEGGSNLSRNAVVFSALRPGSSAPRRIMCLLGMGDSLFPRTENRPAYDLLRGSRRMGDRSAIIEDRMAFLEAVMNARERLLISYQARSEEDNSKSCESVLVRELTEYISQRFGKGCYSQTIHRLQAFHPAYYGGDPDRADLFSFSKSNLAAAKRLLAPKAEDLEAPVFPKSFGSKVKFTIEIEELIKFFENPARYYYKHILGADPKPNFEDLPADTETFKPDALEEWKIRAELLDVLVEGDDQADRDILLKEFVADGTIPLGKWGQQWFSELVQELILLLDTPLPPFGTLRDAWLANKATPSRELLATIDVDGIQVTLCGFVRIQENGRILNFRCATPKVKLRLRAWLTHLLALAAGESATSMAVQGRKAKKLEIYEFVPRETAESDSAPDPKNLLADYLRLFLLNCAPPPPYTPETSLVYLEALGGDEDNHANALAEAQKAWKSDGFSFREDKDLYLYSVFGEKGPFRNEQAFAEMAKRVLGPMVQHQADQSDGGEQ